MFHALRRYPEYRLAGGWISSVPYAWCWQPARTLFTERKVTGFIDEDLLSVTIGRGVIPQSALLSTTAKRDSSNLDKSKYKLVEPGDLVYNKMRAWQGAAGGSRYRGIVSPAYVVMRPRAVLTEYMHHLLRTPMFASEAERWSYGITSDQWSLRPEHFKMIRFPVPPSDEQTAIVKYLEHANARIDKAIAAKRRLIDLLDEHVASAQNSLVEAPAEGDEFVSIGQTSYLVQTGPFGSQLHAHEYVEDGIPVINPAHIVASGLSPDRKVSVSPEKADELDRHRLEPGDVVLARRGDLGRSAVVLGNQAGWLCGTGSLLVRLDLTRWVPDYFQMAFSSRGNKDRLQVSSIGSTMANLNASQVSRMRMRVPTLAEQRALIRKVRSLQEEHATQVAVVAREIELLQEFRTRLVADVVTGQVDVRAIAATLPDVPDVFDELDAILDDELEEALSENLGE